MGPGCDWRKICQSMGERTKEGVSEVLQTPELYEQAVQFFIHDEKISNYCDGITTMYYIENKEQKILCISF